MTPSVAVEDLQKSFGDVVAVDGVSFSVEPGRICGLLGPNGAGKTTTLRMLMDIIAPDSGTVRLFGRPRQRRDAERIGYLPEERGLYRRMKVVDQLAFLGELHGQSRQQSMPTIESWLERVGLSDWGRRKVEELSKGMQQKIQLVGTVLHDPDLLILDEPFSGLDPINQQLFKELLADYKERGKTILLSTHVMEQAEKLCDEICLISHGRVVLDGNLAAIKRRRGGNSYRLVADGDLSPAIRLPGVAHVVAHDEYVRLILESDADGSAVLEQLTDLVRVREYRSEEPDLEEIFISAVEDAAEKPVPASDGGAVTVAS